MMKKTAAMILSVIMIWGLAVSALADEIIGRDDMLVTYTADGTLEDNFDSNDFSDSISGLQPGDSVKLTIRLKNANANGSNWYMSNEVLDSLEEADAQGSAYGYLLVYNGPDGSRTLYDSETVGGDDSAGLYEATEGLQDLFWLGAMTAGQEATVELTVSLDGETEGNDYFDTAASLKMNFAVEPVEETPSPSSSPKPSSTTGKVVQTGDDTNLFPFYVAMAVSGLLFLALAIDSVRRRRKEQEEMQ